MRPKKFLVQNQRLHTPPPDDVPFPVVVLSKDNWNDFGFRTVCVAHLYLSRESEVVEIGSFHIMRRGQSTGPWVFENGPIGFHSLKDMDEDYCALSSALEFYQRLKDQGQDFAIGFLEAVCDAAYDATIWNAFEDDTCFETSLLRSKSSAIEVRDKVPNLFGREQALIESFVYTVQLPGAKNAHSVDFDFSGDPGKPNRLNLLVGRNGSGKTQLLAKLAIALSGITREAQRQDQASQRQELEKRQRAGTVEPVPSFYDIIAISFNAFDQFEVPKRRRNAKFRYTYCGIRKSDGSLYSAEELISNIKAAVKQAGPDQKEAIERTLKSVLELDNVGRFFGAGATRNYRTLSAGQRIALNILVHLIANLKDRSLVLFDEPETHLHPSLMATLITELFWLLREYHSYAILATHSPIIAQQVPSRLIRVIGRTDNFVEVNRPNIECFGENLSEITNALFETREHERDYTSIIDGLLERYNFDPERVEAEFPDGLGANARIYLWASANRPKE